MRNQEFKSSTKAFGFLAVLAILLTVIASGFSLPSEPFSESAFSPKVRGQVINEEEKPMPGVAILVEGSTTGTATDMDGFFELDLAAFSGKKVVLVLSFIDYSSHKIEIEMDKLPKDYGQIQMAKE